MTPIMGDPTGDHDHGEGRSIDTDARPAIRRGLLTAELRGRHVVFDPDARDLFELRADVAALWPVLDGSATLGTLAHDMAMASALSRDQALTLLRALLEPLVADHLLVVLPTTADHR